MESWAQQREQPSYRLLVSFLPDCTVARFGSMSVQKERFILSEVSSDRRSTPASRAGSILRGSLVRNMREEWDWQERPYRQTSTWTESFLGLHSSKR